MPTSANDLKKYAAVDSGSSRMQEPQDVEIARRLILEEAADVAGGEEGVLPEVTGDYVLVSEIEEVARIVKEARAQAVVSMEVMASSQAGQSASLMGVALATAPGRAYYLPVGHEQSASFKEAFSSFEEGELVEALSPLFHDQGVLKVGYNVKLAASLLQRISPHVTLAPFDDTMLMSSCIDAGRRDHSFLEMARQHLRLIPPSFERLAEDAGTVKAKGKRKVSLESLPPAVMYEHAAGLADMSLRLHSLLRPVLAMEGVAAPYQLMEQPLVNVLARMEARGVAVDRDMLETLSLEYAGKLKQLETKIFKIAGREFLISSPKQLSVVLFEELRLPKPSKKSKGGEYSTGAEVLDNLVRGGHEIARLVDDWRAITKLKSTYSDPLVTHINARTGRIHTSYQMAATATGRLSSVDPNLQNIPTSGVGQALREAFVAPPGHVLLSADYSQIELRLLAHMAKVPALQEAFANKVDVHRLTASQVWCYLFSSLTSCLTSCLYVFYLWSCLDALHVNLTCLVFEYSM